MQGWANIEKNVLKDRLDSVFLFRYQHHKLQKVIKETIGQEGSAESKNFEEMALKEINEAHALMININILDLTP